LIADDHATNRAILMQMLLPLDFRLIEVADGQSCLATAQQWQPDLILLDLRMPGLDGFEVARQLRQQAAFQHVAIVAVSASVSEEIRQRSLAAGCNVFLAKPVKLDEVLACLQTHLQLEWISAAAAESGKTPAVQRPFDPAMVTRLPSDVRQQLFRCAEQGHVKGLRQLLTELERLQPELLPLIEELRRLAKGFQVDALAELLRE
jgi:CheY-like chemotaxis protein